MSDFKPAYSTANTQVGYDEGLRSFFAGIYKYMFMAMIWTGVVAAYVARDPQMVMAIAKYNLLFVGGLLAMSFLSGFVVPKLSKSSGLAYFFVYATLIGAITSFYVYNYTGETVARAFFMTSALFGALSFFGYTTKKDISGMGTILMVGMVVAIGASFSNFFVFQSSAMMMAISAAVILLSAGIVAYTTQGLKYQYYELQGSRFMNALQILGAITLYTSFINIFWSLMNILGSSE